MVDLAFKGRPKGGHLPLWRRHTPRWGLPGSTEVDNEILGLVGGTCLGDGGMGP